MRVLLTNCALAQRTGTELFVAELALQLLRRGHQPMVFAPRLGPLAEALLGRTVPVVPTLSGLTATPDVIHGQHFFETAAALVRFPEVGALYVCHDWSAWFDEPPKADQIRRFAGISEHAVERLVTRSGAPAPMVRRLSNWVDIHRFKPSRVPAARPVRALALSNYMSEENVLPQIRMACEQLDIELVTAGAWMGGMIDDPSEVLGGFDLVFARGRTALEAMASGAAVIQVDKWGLAGLVSPASFATQSRANFGLRAESRQVTVEALIDEIRRYDAAAVEAVTELVRAQHGLEPAVDRVVELYEEVLESVSSSPCQPMTRELVADMLCHVGEIDRMGSGWYAPRLRPPEPDAGPLSTRRRLRNLGGRLLRRVRPTA